MTNRVASSTNRPAAAARAIIRTKSGCSRTVMPRHLIKRDHCRRVEGLAVLPHGEIQIRFRGASAGRPQPADGLAGFDPVSRPDGGSGDVAVDGNNPVRMADEDGGDADFI